MEQSNIIDMYEAGHSIKDIGHRLHIYPSNIRHTLHEAGYRNTRTYRNLSPAMVRVVNVLLNRHVAYRDIEAYCDISFDAIRGCAKQFGKRVRSTSSKYVTVEPDAYYFPDLVDFLDRYDRGESFTRIAEDLVLTDNQIYAVFYLLWSKAHLDAHRKNMAARVHSQLNSGFSLAAVAKREHISYAIVRSICKN